MPISDRITFVHVDFVFISFSIHENTDHIHKFSYSDKLDLHGLAMRKPQFY